jgi:hypothetical protein
VRSHLSTVLTIDLLESSPLRLQRAASSRFRVTSKTYLINRLTMLFRHAGVVAMARKEELTDEQWPILAPLIPARCAVQTAAAGHN